VDWAGAKTPALSIYSMQIYIEMLELLIQQYVFINNNKEKANVYKARDDAKEQLSLYKTYLSKEIERLEQNVEKRN
jgi:hypothetical protein